MSIKQALAHPCATDFIKAFADKVQALKEYLGDPKDIKKGSLLLSKEFFQ
jgi:hypothetical protein